MAKVKVHNSGGLKVVTPRTTRVRVGRPVTMPKRQPTKPTKSTSA